MCSLLVEGFLFCVTVFFLPQHLTQTTPPPPPPPPPKVLVHLVYANMTSMRFSVVKVVTRCIEIHYEKSQNFLALIRS